jgi:hypothetical protein
VKIKHEDGLTYEYDHPLHSLLGRSLLNIMQLYHCVSPYDEIYIDLHITDTH